MHLAIKIVEWFKANIVFFVFVIVFFLKIGVDEYIVNM